MISEIRITPAYAGKSVSAAFQSLHTGDHPRICGEKVANHRIDDLEEGSPPHMRGKEKTLEEMDEKQGITPAYAGKRLPLEAKLTLL